MVLGFEYGFFTDESCFYPDEDVGNFFTELLKLVVTCPRSGHVEIDADNRIIISHRKKLDLNTRNYKTITYKLPFKTVMKQTELLFDKNGSDQC